MNRLGVLLAIFVLAGCAGVDRLGETPELFVVDVESGERWQPSGDGRFFSSPSWSPDGRRLAVVASSSGSATIEVVDVERRTARVVARQPGTIHGLAWSPRGTPLAFVRVEEETSWTVETVAPDGSAPRQVAVHESGRVAWPGPSWSPDGERLAYAVGADTFVVSPRSTTRSLLAREAGDPRWSPGGRLVSVLQGDRLVAVPANGGEPSTIASNLIDAHAAWSPASDRVAFAGVAYVGDRRYHLSVATPGLDRPRRIADEAVSHDPAWSPDGRALAYATWDGRIRVIDLAGGGVRTLTRIADAQIRDLAWSPDGSRLAFVARHMRED